MNNRYYDLENHIHSIPYRSRPTFTQTRLTNKFGLLSISKPTPPPIKHHRTPLPHAVRRIANTSTFSTTDPSLTTFCRFPPEIRIQIYRLLLKYDGQIRYAACLIKKCIIRADFGRTRYRARHGLFPSILECCWLINREGTAVLYGENYFETSCYISEIPVFDIPCPNVLAITKMRFGWYDLGDNNLKQMDLLPSLSEVGINVWDITGGAWKFLISERVRSMRKVTLYITARENAEQWMSKTSWPASVQSNEDKCRWTYERPFLHQYSLWENKKVRWEFDLGCPEGIDSGYIGDITVSLDSVDYNGIQRDDAINSFSNVAFLSEDSS
jgi:hypothetical protein